MFDSVDLIIVKKSLGESSKDVTGTDPWTHPPTTSPYTTTGPLGCTNITDAYDL